MADYVVSVTLQARDETAGPSDMDDGGASSDLERVNGYWRYIQTMVVTKNATITARTTECGSVATQTWSAQAALSKARL